MCCSTRPMTTQTRSSCAAHERLRVALSGFVLDSVLLTILTFEAYEEKCNFLFSRIACDLQAHFLTHDVLGFAANRISSAIA